MPPTDEIRGPALEPRGGWRPVLLLPAALVALLYVATLWNGLVYDDAWLVGRFETWDPDLWTRITQRRALTYALQGLEYDLFGASAPGYHATSLVLHAIASGLAAGLAAKLAGSLRVGLVCGGLFAAHPVHVEAVASFTNTGDVLAMIFLSGAVWTWASAGAAPARRGAALVLMLAALHAKPAAAAGGLALWPFLHFLVLRPARNRPRAVAAWLGGGAAAALVLGALLAASGAVGGLFSAAAIRQTTQGVVGAYPDVLATSLASVPTQLRLLFAPLTLSFDYPITVPATPTSPAVLVGAALLALWLGTAVALAGRYPVASFGLLWVVLTFLPASNLAPLTQFFVAERYLYVPSFGACLAVAVGIDALWRRAETRPPPPRSAVAAFAMALVALASARTVARTLDWRDEARLARASLDAGIESRRIHHMAGEALWREKDFAGAGRHFARSVELQPNAAWLRLDLAAALVMQGETDLARKQARVEDLAPKDGIKAIRSRHTLARAYLSRDLPRDAALQLEAILATAPDDTAARSRLAWLYAASEDAGLRDPGRALALLGARVDATALCLRSTARAHAGESEAALADAMRAIELARRDGDGRTAQLAAAFAHRYRDGDGPPALSGPQILGLPL